MDMTVASWLHRALKKAGDEGPDQIRIVRLEARAVGMSEAVIGVGEEVPLHELAVGDEALPEWALDGRRGHVVLATADHHGRAGELPREREGMARPVRRLRLVAHGWIVEDDGPHLRVVGGEGDEEPPAHAVADAPGARGVRAHAIDEIAPRLVHLAEELGVRVLGLEVRPHADVIRARHAEHVEEARHEHVEGEGGESVRVDLVVGGDTVGVMHHEDARALARTRRLRHVAGEAVVFLGEHAGDSHERAPSRAAFTRSGRKGTVRRRTPVASNTALPRAAGTGVEAASPTPRGGWSRRWISSNSSFGTSGKVRMGYEAQSTVVTRSRS